jgi:hypothetical protein
MRMQDRRHDGLQLRTLPCDLGAARDLPAQAQRRLVEDPDFQ